MHAKLLIRHCCLSVCWVTAPNGRLWRKGFELTAEKETEEPDSVNTSPFGILESGGSQHSMWKPRSHESQNSISSWKGKAGMCKGCPYYTHVTPTHHLNSFGNISPIVHKRGFTNLRENQQILRDSQNGSTSEWTTQKMVLAKMYATLYLQHFCPVFDRSCRFCIQCTANVISSHLRLIREKTSDMMDAL